MPEAVRLLRRVPKKMTRRISPPLISHPCRGGQESLHRKSPLAANAASQDVGVHLTKAQSNKMREQVNKATVLTMNDNTWYLNDQHYDAVVVKVLGKVDVAAAKENWPLYITVVGMAEVAARNHRAETGTNITKEFADKWYGENDFPFTQEGVYVSRIATDYLKDNFFRTSGRADYFGCEEYREIIWNAYPDPNPAAADDLARDLGHNHIAHMSAPTLAFVEIKVRSLLNNDKSLPKGGRVADKMVGEYEAIMSAIKTMTSIYVDVKNPTQHASTRTPGLGRGGTYHSPRVSHLSNSSQR
ncbi:TPA: hypothetical protein ACH3X2_000812 [Trebouxia sp. C0005]